MRTAKNSRIPAFLRTKKAKILLAILAVLILLRLALPYIVLRYSNKTLAEMEGYYGHIRDIDIALYRGAYTIDSFYLNKLDDKTSKQTEFISARTIDLSLEWRALFKGRLVGELVFDRSVMIFTENKVELKDVSQDTSDFRELLKDFMPVDVNNCELRDGKLAYIDNTREPKVDVAISDLDATAKNLRNVYATGEVLPATIEATGNMYKGNLSLNMKLNPLADEPTFDLNSKVEKTDLTEINDMFKAYGGFDVNKGTFGMYTEIAAKDGKFTGYVKPLIKDLDIVSWQGQDKKDGFFQKIWESVVGGVGELFENQKKDQFATKINFSGDMDNPRVNILQAIVTVLQNAFIRSLQPSIDNQINLAKVDKEGGKKEGFFKQLFDSDKKDKDGKEDKNEKKDKDEKKEKKKGD